MTKLFQRYFVHAVLPEECVWPLAKRIFPRPMRLRSAALELARLVKEEGGIYIHVCKAIKRVKVESSNIVSVGYNLEHKILEIEFHGGAIYPYYEVPPEIADGLVGAESAGKYFHANIKDKFPVGDPRKDPKLEA